VNIVAPLARGQAIGDVRLLIKRQDDDRHGERRPGGRFYRVRGSFLNNRRRINGLSILNSHLVDSGGPVAPKLYQTPSANGTADGTPIVPTAAKLADI
jgi:hypothetical protein